MSVWKMLKRAQRNSSKNSLSDICTMGGSLLYAVYDDYKTLFLLSILHTFILECLCLRFKFSYPLQKIGNREQMPKPLQPVSAYSLQPYMGFSLII